MYSFFLQRTSIFCSPDSVARETGAADSAQLLTGRLRIRLPVLFVVVCIFSPSLRATPQHVEPVDAVPSAAESHPSLSGSDGITGCRTPRLDTSVTQVYHGDTLRLRVRLDSITSGGYALVTKEELPDGLHKRSRWLVRHPVFRIALGDIDGDGWQDICIGAIKATRHDPVARKRLLVYSLRGGYIRPLWLGSFLGQTIDDFALVHDARGACIETLTGRRTDRSHGRHRWRWQVFGFTHERVPPDATHVMPFPVTITGAKP